MLTRIVRRCEEARRSNLIIVLLLPIYLFAQNQTAIRYSQFITASDIKQNISVLASDSLEGRETGKLGQKKAADYIAKQFESFGIPSVDSGYFQKYTICNVDPSKVTIKINGKQLEYGKDFYHDSDFKNDSINSNTLVSFNYSDYALFGGVYVINDDHIHIDELKNIENCKVIFIVTRKPNCIVGANKVLRNKAARSHVPIFYISPKTYKKLTKKKVDKRSDRIFKVKIEIDININTVLFEGENVLGYVEGSDLKEELIVVSAHYDHLGFHDGKTYYGADDNASGTSAIIALAKAFAQAKREGHGPRRSILFLAFSGEEKGLLGSSYYSDHPVFPLANTVADLNIDMIGRIDTTYKTDPNYIYLIGSDKLSSELHNISDSTNSMYTQLKLDYKFNDPNDKNRFYYRSDHYNLAKHNIPVIFYFNGVHEDYHKPTDTVDKINFDKVEKISKLVFFTAWKLANRDKRIVVDKENDFKGTR